MLGWLPNYSLFLGLGLVLVALTGQRLILFPPLLVIAYELMVHPDTCPWRGRPFSMILGCTAAAAMGTLLASWWGVVPPATALTVVLVEALQRLLGFRMLPAFGAGLLPFLLPNHSLAFPLSVALGTSLLALVMWISSWWCLSLPSLSASDHGCRQPGRAGKPLPPASAPAAPGSGRGAHGPSPG